MTVPVRRGVSTGVPSAVHRVPSSQTRRLVPGPCRPRTILRHVTHQGRIAPKKENPGRSLSRRARWPTGSRRAWRTLGSCRWGGSPRQYQPRSPLPPFNATNARSLHAGTGKNHRIKIHVNGRPARPAPGPRGDRRRGGRFPVGFRFRVRADSGCLRRSPCTSAGFARRSAVGFGLRRGEPLRVGPMPENGSVRSGVTRGRERMPTFDF